MSSVPPESAPTPSFDVMVCGSLNLDIVSQVPRLPTPGETLAATALSRLPGGKGLNQAVAAARQQAKVALLGAMGDDSEAAVLRGVMQEEGILSDGVLNLAAQPTGLAFIQVADDAENAIVIHAGANGAVTADYVRANIQLAKVYLAQLEVPVEAVHEFFVQAKLRNGLCILNAAPAMKAAISLFEKIDILIVNETELRLLAVQVGASDELDEISLARCLLTNSLRTVIVTVGARGAWLVHSDSATLIPAPPVVAIDTTGAGDCFCGVLAAALAEERSLTDAVQCAVLAAAASVQAIGAISAMPSRR